MELKANGNKISKKAIAPLFVIVAGICWGFIGVFSRFLSAGGLNTVQTTASRATVTAVSLSICLLIVDRQKFKIDIKDLWMFFGTGVIAIVFCNICYFYTIQTTTLSIASILLYTSPSFVLILSFFLFKEKFTKQKVIALILAFTGCVLITGIIGSEHMNVTPFGILAGVASGFCYALYSIFGRIALKKYDPMTVTVYTFIVAAVCILPFSGAPDMVSIAVADPTVFLNMILLGIIATLIPFLLYTQGLKYMETGKASVMAFLEPMVSTIAGIIIFNEQITFQNIVGIALIFVSVVLLNIKIKLPKAEPTKQIEEGEGEPVSIETANVAPEVAYEHINH